MALLTFENDGLDDLIAILIKLIKCFGVIAKQIHDETRLKFSGFSRIGTDVKQLIVECHVFRKWFTIEEDEMRIDLFCLLDHRVDA